MLARYWVWGAKGFCSDEHPGRARFGARSRLRVEHEVAAAGEALHTGNIQLPPQLH
jgi:hypothetical protein